MNLFAGWLLLWLIAGISALLSGLFVLGGKHPVEASALAIVIGISFRHFRWVPAHCEPGVKWSEKFLALGIVLMGAGLNFKTVFAQGSGLLAVILVTMLVGFTLIYGLGKLLALPSMLSMLLAIGTTICGTTAIAIVAPLMKAPKEQTAYAVGTVALCGLIALLIYPPLGHWLGASDLAFGIFAGTAIHSTPQVVGAGFMFSDLAGQTATAVKLIRNCFIAPMALVVAVAYSGSKAGALRAFPWFLFGFFALAWCGSLGFFSSGQVAFCNELGKFLILVGMAGVGLNTDLKAFQKVGFKPLAVGAFGSVLVAVVSLGMIYLIV
ncbi:MAG: putative sulfate exporter family transporter [Myxococcota bacterium]